MSKRSCQECRQESILVEVINASVLIIAEMLLITGITEIAQT